MLQQLLNISKRYKTCKAIKLCTFIYFLLVLIGYSSCTQQVNVDLQNGEQKYVINCLLTPDEQIKLFAYKTTGILENKIVYADELEIEFFKNEKLLWSGNESDSGKYSIPVQPEPNEKYKVILKNQEGLSLSATDLLPSRVKILSATYLFPVYKDIYGSSFGKVSLSFRDIPEIQNFYEIILLSRDSSVNRTFNINSRVISVDNENDPNPPGSLLFTDELFEGEKLDLTIFVATYDEPIIVLRNVSRNYYEYRKSITSHFYNQNTKRDDVYNLFKADPVELYSNVDNGLGIFAGFTQDVVVCKKLNN